MTDTIGARAIAWRLSIATCVVACGPGAAPSSGTADAGGEAGESGGESGGATAESGSAGESEGSTGAELCAERCQGTAAGHACCADVYGAGFYCGPESYCVQASGCEAADCCIPGADGDAYCMATFGAESVCIPEPTDGRCGRLVRCADYDNADDCDADPECMSEWMSALEPGPGGLWCVSDAIEWKGCLASQGCGDAETVFCDEVGAYWWSSDTCGPEGWSPCDPGAPWDFCGGG